jgi:hypothetical protein
MLPDIDWIKGDNSTFAMIVNDFKFPVVDF